MRNRHFKELLTTENAKAMLRSGINDGENLVLMHRLNNLRDETDKARATVELLAEFGLDANVTGYTMAARRLRLPEGDGPVIEVRIPILDVLEITHKPEKPPSTHRVAALVEEHKQLLQQQDALQRKFDKLPDNEKNEVEDHMHYIEWCREHLEQHCDTSSKRR